MRKILFTLLISFSFLFIGDKVQLNHGVLTLKMRYAEMVTNHPYNQRPGYSKSDLKAIPKADRPDLAMERDFLMTMDPLLGYPPRERLNSIIKSLFKSDDEQDQSQGFGAAQAGATWVERGPASVGGRTRGLMWDPNDVSGKKVWAGATSGGLWYNNDITSSASQWVNVSDMWANLGVSVITHDPVNDDNYYVGTGESWTRRGGNGSHLVGFGIWKSSDQGSTWTQLSAASNLAYVNDIVVKNESGNGVIYAASERTTGFSVPHGVTGIMRSTDGGASFTNVHNLEAVNDLEIAADGRIWAGTKNGKVLYSDNGVTWTQSTSGLGNRVELGVAPSDANYVYAIFESANAVGGIRFSSNKGGAWVAKTEPADADDGIPNDDFSRGQAWYDLILTVDPNDKNKIYVGGIDFFRSFNNGDSWEQITKWSNNNNLAALSVPLVHADQHQMIFKPGSSSEAVFGNDGGVFYTSNLTASQTSLSIAQRNNAYNVTQFYCVAQGPNNGQNLYLGGAQDNGTSQLTSPGFSEASAVGGGDGAFCHIDQINSDIRIISSQSGNYQYTRNGSSYSSLTSGGDFIDESDYDDVAGIMYSDGNGGTSSSLKRTINIKSGTVSSSNISPTGYSGSASHFKVSPFVNTTLMVGTAQGDLFRITGANGGSPAATNIASGSMAGHLSCVEFGATANEMVAVYANFGVNNIWYTSDGGVNWTAKDGNLPDMPVRWALFNPDNNKQVLIATELGTWFCDDITVSSPVWTPANNGLANVRIDMLQIRSSDKQVLAGTHGRGFFTNDAAFDFDAEAFFTADVTEGCASLTVTFTNNSLGSNNNYKWNFGDPASVGNNTSTLENPTHTYTESGFYTVQLIATDAIDPGITDTLTELDFIEIYVTKRLPYSLDFEVTQFPYDEFTITQDLTAQDELWQRASVSAFGVGTGSAVLPNIEFNFSNIANGNSIILPAIDLASAISPQLSFDVAYEQFYSRPFTDSLTVLISSDCGETFQSSTYKKGLNNLFTNNGNPSNVGNYSCGGCGTFTPYIPTNSQWRRESVDLSSAVANGGTGLIIAIERAGPRFSNHLYIDNIFVDDIGVPEAGVLVDNDTICVNQSVTYSDVSRGRVETYSWNFGAGASPATATGPGPHTVTYTTAGKKTVNQTVTGPYGSENKNFVDIIEVFPLPSTSAISGPSAVCEDVKGTQFSVNSAANSSFQWSVTGNASIVSGNGSNIIAVDFIDQNTQITVVQTNTLTGCVGLPINKSIQVNPLPEANAGNDATICDGESLSIGMSPIGGVSYSWTPTTNVQSPNTATTSVSPKVTTTYTLKATVNSSGCFKTDQVTITANPVPEAFTIANSVNCSDDSLAIGKSPDVVGNTYSWSPTFDMDDPTSSNPKVSPNSNTTYTLTETITATGCTNSNAVTLQINPEPSAITGGSIKYICLGDSFKLGAPAKPGNTYVWTPTTGLSNPNISDPQAKPIVSTDYTLTETVLSTGCDLSRTITINVEQPPNAITGADKTQCSNDTTQIGAAPIGGNTYFWSPSAGLDNVSLANPMAFPQFTTTYTLLETSAKGCTKTNEVIITVNPAPAAFTGGDRILCNTDTITIGGAAIAGNTYSWTYNPDLPAPFNTTFTTSTVEVSPILETVYTLIEKTTGTNCQTEKSITVTPTTAGVAVDVSAEASPSNTVCFGETINFEAISSTSGDNPTYQWQKNGSNIGGETDRFFSSSTLVSGNKIRVIMTSDLICADGNTNPATSGEITVTVNPNPAPLINVSKVNPLCPGDSVILTASEGVSWQWSNGKFTESIKIGQSGVFSVSVENASGCEGSSPTYEVEYTPAPVPNPGANQAICIGESVDIGAPSVTDISYSWTSDLSGFTSTDAMPNVSPSITTKYYLNIVDDITGCTAIDSVLIEVTPIPIPVAGTDQSICIGESADIGETGISGFNYLWKSNPVGFNSTIGDPTVSSSVTTVYEVIIANNSSGCKDSAEITITVKPQPEITDLSGDEIICADNESQITAQGTAGSQIDWFDVATNGSSIFTGPTFSTPPLSGNSIYFVEPILNGCLGDRLSFEVEVINNPTAPEITGGNAYCFGENVTLEVVNPSQSLTYEWFTDSENGIKVHEGFSLNLDLMNDTSYFVGTSLNGSCNSASRTRVDLIAIPNPTIELAQDSIFVCEGEDIILNLVDYSTLDSIKWYNYSFQSGSISTSDTLQFTDISSGGTYHVVAYSNGCVSNFDSVTISIIEVISDFEANETQIVLGDTIRFTNLSTVDANYLWDFGDGELSQDFEPEHIYAFLGTYSVSLNVTIDGCNIAETKIDYIVVDMDISVELKSDLDLSISMYPNPATDNITIEVSNPDLVSALSITDVTGKLVKTIDEIQLRNTSILISDLSPGVYMLGIELIDGTVANEQLIITK
ncbi:MAG: PKD repeat protein [Sphingobacteriales bacterium]|jgi:PKD repeat protein